jgi:hypothetical protein
MIGSLHRLASKEQYKRAGDYSDDTTRFVASKDELIAVKSLSDAGLGGVDAEAMPGLSPFSLKLGKGAGLWR